jgi:hypothetical protein
LEDTEDYAAFEMAVTADYDARSAVERELVLRLASLLWRLRRATAIESGLFKIQARHMLQFRQRRRAQHNVVENVHQNFLATEGDPQQDKSEPNDGVDSALSASECADRSDDITRSFVRLASLSTYPLDRLSRYEAGLWRQARQVVFTLKCLNQRNPWEGLLRR